MSLLAQLKEDRVKIHRAWFQEILDSFPRQSRGLIADGKDRFSNPMGHTLNDGILEILSALLGEKTLEEAEPAVAQLIKLRAVQKEQKENPVEFLFALKKIVRKNSGAYGRKFTQVGELLEIEDRLDAIILRALEIFVESREKLLELRVNEMRNKTHMFLRMAGEHY